uniref:F-box domain-containing protein n=1 Tax=Arcella intermedia TaxID=1963864 RepID=A0A6B2L0D0_9EUKA
MFDTWGILPPPLYNHTSAIHDHFLLIFGGFLKVGKSNSIYQLNLETHEWTSPSCKGDLPQPIEGMTGVLLFKGTENEQFVIFGGRNSSWTSNNDTYSLSLSTMTWTRLACTGDIPSARTAYSLNVYCDTHLLLFGGYDDGGQFIGRKNDFYVLNLLSRVWSKFELRGEIPRPVSEHRGVVYGESLVIFGGWDHHKHELNLVYQLDLKNLLKELSEVKGKQKKDKKLRLTWRFVPCLGDEPRGRRMFSMNLLDNMVFVFGGEGANGFFYNDMYQLELPILDISAKKSKKHIKSDLFAELFSDDILKTIFKNCEGEDLVSCSRVSKRWNALSSSEDVWQKAFSLVWNQYNSKFNRDFPTMKPEIKRFLLHENSDFNIHNYHKSKNSTWKMEYQIRSLIWRYTDPCDNQIDPNVLGLYCLFFPKQSIVDSLYKYSPGTYWFFGVFSTKLGDYSLVKGIICVKENQVSHFFSPLFSKFNESFFSVLYGSKISKNEKKLEQFSSSVMALIETTTPMAQSKQLLLGRIEPDKVVIQYQFLLGNSPLFKLDFTFKEHKKRYVLISIAKL